MSFEPADGLGNASHADSHRLFAGSQEPTESTRWAGPIVCAAAFVAATAWSWRKWPDPLIDFGRELYIPWQLTEGRVLYRDLAVIYGPLSKYLQALAMRIGGVSLTTLIVCNLTIFAGILTLLYRLIALHFGRFTASVACLVVMAVFGFSQYLVTANYNFVCPYSHEATHGVALALAMIASLARAGEPRRWRWLLAGLCLGGVWLTRAEVALAATAAGVLAVVILWRSELPKSKQITTISSFVGAAFFPALAFFAYFCTKMPAADAVRAVGGSWTTLAAGGVAGHYFYSHGMGLDAAGANGLLMFKATLALAVGALVAAALDFALRKRIDGRRVVAVAIGATVLAVLAYRPNLVDWSMAGRTLSVVGLVAAITSVRSCIRGADRSNVAPALFSVFAFVLLAKMLLAPRLDFTGFYLAMPAAVVFVVYSVEAIPRWLARRWGGGMVFRFVALAVVIAGVVAHVRYSNAVYETKDFAVGAGCDRFYAQRPEVYPGGLACAEALKKIDEIMPPEATFVALPEGVMLNYLSRRVNPTPYTQFSTTELQAFGEERMLASLREHPPDFVVLVHKESEELGVGYFGSDPRFGAKIMQWVRENYADAVLIGYEPLRERKFGIKFMKRREAG
jgi:dolichyl-phosphate-mannose-protein mannosyltransferase